MEQLSHISEGLPAMVNVSGKTSTVRTATARSIVCFPHQIAEDLESGALVSSKGSVFQAAIIGGIMAAKKTGELIPLCHSLPLEHCNITIAFNEAKELVIDCTARITSKTGVEMEALIGASMAALTVYDMCKALSHDIIIRETRLLSKTGGKSNYDWNNNEQK